MAWLEPVTLVGRHARLEPLEPAHADGLAAAVRDGEVWKLWYTMIPPPEKMAAAIDRSLEMQARGTMLPFAVRDAGGRLVGFTTYLNVDAVHHRVEIGATWYAQSVQRTAINTECKLMLLRHAFETLSCIAVELRTHFMNRASRRAIERLGARLDGILRHHQVMPDGTLRDTCVYSIVAPDWPTTRSHLEHELARVR